MVIMKNKAGSGQGLRSLRIILACVLFCLLAAPEHSLGSPSQPRPSLFHESQAPGNDEPQNEDERSFPKEPVLCLDKMMYDFGEVLTGDVVQKRITIQNKGGSELALYRFEFSCGCSIPRITLSNGKTVSLREYKQHDKVLTLKPGETATMLLEFTSLGQKGRMTYKMVLHSNDPKHPELTIPILATVKQAFSIEPKLARFGIVKKGGTATMCVEIKPLVDMDFEITGFSNLPSFISCELERSGETPDSGYRARITISGNAPAETYYFQLRAEVKSQKTAALVIPVTFNIRPEVHFYCKNSKLGRVLNFGIIQSENETSKNIRILNKNPAVPYNITDIGLSSVYSEHIDVELTSIKAGVEYELLVTIKPGLNAHYLKGIITLTSDHPDLIKKKIALSGLCR